MIRRGLIIPLPPRRTRFIPQPSSSVTTGVFWYFFHLSVSGIEAMAFSYRMGFRPRPRAEAFRPVQRLAGCVLPRTRCGLLFSVSVLLLLGTGYPVPRADAQSHGSTSNLGLAQINQLHSYTLGNLIAITLSAKAS